MSDVEDDRADERAGDEAGASLADRIAGLCAPTLADMGYELVRVTLLGRDRPTVQVMADRSDGSLIAVDDCERISRAIGAVLDVEDPMAGAWSLEVSSAGINRPLTRVKDWNRFAGHLARVDMAVPVADIRRAKLVLTDTLIAASAPPAAPQAH